MNRNLLISIAVGVAVFIVAMLRTHLTGEEWLVSPAQLSSAAKNGTYIHSDNGGITGLPIRKANAHLLKYKWTLMGVLAGFACFHFLRRANPSLKRPDFVWSKDKFYWTYKDYPELGGQPEQVAKARLNDMVSQHGPDAKAWVTQEAKVNFVELAVLLLFLQLLFGFGLGACIGVGVVCGTLWARIYGQRIPALIRAELQAQKNAANAAPETPDAAQG